MHAIADAGFKNIPKQRKTDAYEDAIMQICIQAIRPICGRNHNDKKNCDGPIASAEAKNSKKETNTQRAYRSLKKLIQPLPGRSEQEKTLSVDRNETCQLWHEK